jgi:hypothetical protein
MWITIVEISDWASLDQDKLTLAENKKNELRAIDGAGATLEGFGPEEVVLANSGNIKRLWNAQHSAENYCTMFNEFFPDIVCTVQEQTA